MRVLILGASGFIGQHLRKRLSDHTVISFDRKRGSETDFLADIANREAVNEAVGLCDRWVNLAGLLGTSELIRRAQDAVDVNITGAVNVFNAAVLHEKPGLQIAVGNHWMINPYSITKSCAEKLARMYVKELGADIRIVRAMNVFGPGQKAKPVRKLVPNIVIPILRGEPVTIYGSGDQVMDMLYVDDAAEILKRVVLADGIPAGEVVEAGAGPITVNEFARLVIREMGQGKLHHVPMRGGEDQQAVVKISEDGARRLKELIGFDIYSDCTPLPIAIHETVKWYTENAD